VVPLRTPRISPRAPRQTVERLQVPENYWRQRNRRGDSAVEIRQTPVPVFVATLFDYNGLLVDDEHVHLESFAEVLAPLGIALDEKTYWDRYLGFDDAGAFEAILLDEGRAASTELVAELVERKRPVYLRRAEAGLRLFPGAAEIGRRRATAGPVVIVSGALRDEIRMGLQLLGVEALVQGIVSAEDTGRSKPDPEGYLAGVRALERAGARDAGRRGVAIEDSTSGIEAAKAAGLACVGVTHSYPRGVLDGAGADLVVASLDELTEHALEELYRRLHA
jgi:beta-phosphoglucomutase